MARYEQWREQGTAIVLVVMVHAAIGWWLEHARPIVPSIREDDDAALQIDYITRTRAAVGPRIRSRRHSSRRFNDLRVDAANRAASAHAAKPATRTTAADSTPPAFLDLRLPTPATLPPASREPFARTRSLAPNTTRFERTWVPAGTALEQASARSVVVGTALALFGGPPKRCSELERRLRQANCLPLHGDDEVDEALRRGVDD